MLSLTRMAKKCRYAYKIKQRNFFGITGNILTAERSIGLACHPILSSIEIKSSFKPSRNLKHIWFCLNMYLRFTRLQYEKRHKQQQTNRNNTRKTFVLILLTKCLNLPHTAIWWRILCNLTWIQRVIWPKKADRPVSRRSHLAWSKKTVKPNVV